MKKIWSVILCVSMLLSLCSGALAEESGSVDFEPTFVSVFDHTAEKWYASRANRAMLSVLLYLQVSNIAEVAALNIEVGDPSYVGYSSDILGLLWQGKDNTLLITYSPFLNRASYRCIEGMASNFVSEYLMDGLFDEYRDNDVEDLKEALIEIRNLLEN